MNNVPAFRPKQEKCGMVNPSEEIDRMSLDFMLEGATKKKDQLSVSHPLEFSEKNYHANLEMQDFVMLRGIQGLHAPMRLQIERNIAKRVQRLNCLPSSNVMLDSLTGRLDNMEFQDVLTDPLVCELAGNPHVLMEKRLGIL